MKLTKEMLKKLKKDELTFVEDECLSRECE